MWRVGLFFFLLVRCTAEAWTDEGAPDKVPMEVSPTPSGPSADADTSGTAAGLYARDFEVNAYAPVENSVGSRSASSDVMISLHDLRYVANVTKTCREAFMSAVTPWATPTCEKHCSGEGGGCRIVREWLAPARTATAKCFAEAILKWRNPKDDFIGTVLALALEHLMFYTQHRANELHNAWQQANSVDPALTKLQTRQRLAWGGVNKKCSQNSGGHVPSFHQHELGFGGAAPSFDFCTRFTYIVESRSCMYKRCGAEQCTEWQETARYDEERRN